MRVKKNGEPVKEWKKLSQIVTKMWRDLHNKTDDKSSFCKGEGGLDWMTTLHPKIVARFEGSTCEPGTLKKQMGILAQVYANTPAFDLEMWRKYRALGLVYRDTANAACAPDAPLSERNKKNAILVEEMDRCHALHLENTPENTIDCKATKKHEQWGLQKGDVIRWSYQAMAIISVQKHFQFRNGNYVNVKWYDGPSKIPAGQNAYVHNADGNGGDLMVTQDYKTANAKDPCGHVTYGKLELKVPSNAADEIRQWHANSPNKDYLWVGKDCTPMNSNVCYKFLRNFAFASCMLEGKSVATQMTRDVLAAEFKITPDGPTCHEACAVMKAGAQVGLHQVSQQACYTERGAKKIAYLKEQKANKEAEQ